MENFTKVYRIGTIPTYGNRRASVYVKAELENGNLSITGVVGPLSSGNALGGCGQIDMEFDHKDKSQNDKRSNPEYLTKASDFNFASGWDAEKWYTLLDIWDKWHLNDLKAECEHQRKLGWTYDTHKGKDCPECDYRIGSAWLRIEIPDDVLQYLVDLPDADKKPAWV